jgi:hypothetical protein
MNIDRILDTCNRHGVNYLLIGGMNFLLRHQGNMTYDLDLWIEDTDDNRLRTEQALSALDAEWGPTDTTWQPVAQMPAGWLSRQSLFSLLSPHGAIDIFRSVRGLPDWQTCFQRAAREHFSPSIGYHAICDEDMLHSQLALDPGLQKPDRVRTLRQVLGLPP